MPTIIGMACSLHVPTLHRGIRFPSAHCCLPPEIRQSSVNIHIDLMAMCEIPNKWQSTKPHLQE